MAIVNSWSIDEFKNLKGSDVRRKEFMNKETGELFESLCFFSPSGGLTLVGFSSKLGTLTDAQIRAQKKDLQITELDSGTYKLCKKGELDDSWKVCNI